MESPYKQPSYFSVKGYVGLMPTREELGEALIRGAERSLSRLRKYVPQDLLAKNGLAEIA